MYVCGAGGQGPARCVTGVHGDTHTCIYLSKIKKILTERLIEPLRKLPQPKESYK